MSSRPGGRVAWVSDAKVRGTVIGNEEVESQVRSARDALECKQLVVANLAKRLEPTPQHEPVDYRSPNAVWEALDESGVRLLSARWLTMFSRRAGAVLPRRQDCPPDAFIKPDELRRMFTNACERSSGDGGSSHDAKPRMPIIAVSQIWDADDSLDAAAPAADLETASADAPSARPDDEDDEGGVGTFAHPDPDGNALHLIGRALREHLHVFSAEGYRDVGVYIGWASTFQSPLALSEAAAHARALPYEGFWFAHSLLTSYHCAAVPEDMPPFRARGWNEFEYRLSWLLQQADGAEVDWARVLQLTESASVRPACRPPPPPPGAFDEGGALYHLPFRGGEAKRALAARRLREIVSEALGAEVRLDYSANEWEDAEAEALGEALHLCVRARWLSLAANERLTRLPAKIEHLSGLRTLVLHGCSGLRTLPDSIGGLRELRTLYLTGCASLLALPDALTTLPHLAELDCSRCVSLPQLPERIGSMAALEALLLNGCASLLRLPERMPHLSGLHLAGCSSLTQLPEQVSGAPPEVVLSPRVMRQLGARPPPVAAASASLPASLRASLHPPEGGMTLHVHVCREYPMAAMYLYGCTALRALPVSLGDLKHLTHIDLGECAALTHLPEGVGALGKLRSLNLHRCASMRHLPPFSTLLALEVLDLSRCSALEALPEGLETLPELSTLRLDGCSLLPLQVRIDRALPPRRHSPSRRSDNAE